MLSKFKINSLQKYFPVIIFLIAFVVRIPLYHTSFWADQDAIDYINVAENIKNGNGVVTDIKWHYFTSDPVISSAFSGRPLLTSVLFAGMLRVIDNYYILQLLILIFASVNAVLFYFLANRFFDKRISFIAGLLAAINPNILITNRLVLSEPVFLCIVVSAFLIFYSLQNSNKKYIILGVLTGLGYLTRMEGVFLLFVLMLFIYKMPKYIVVLLLSFVLTISPYLYGNYINNHALFYSYNIYHFQVKNISQGYWSGFNKIFPSPISFITNNISWILSAVINRVIGNIKVMVDFGFLGLLTVPVLLSIKHTRKFLPMVFFGMLVFINYSIIWSAYGNPERHLIPLFLFLSLPVFGLLQLGSYGAQQVSSWFSWYRDKKLIAIFIIIITSLVYVVMDIHRIIWARNIEYPGYVNNFKQKESAYQWIKNNTGSNDIVSSWAPHEIYLYTHHPAIILPDNLNDEENYDKFINTYHTKYFFLEDVKYVEIMNKKAKLEFEKNGVWIYCVMSCSD